MQREVPQRERFPLEEVRTSFASLLRLRCFAPDEDTCSVGDAFIFVNLVGRITVKILEPKFVGGKNSEQPAAPDKNGIKYPL